MPELTIPLMRCSEANCRSAGAGESFVGTFIYFFPPCSSRTCTRHAKRPRVAQIQEFMSTQGSQSRAGQPLFLRVCGYLTSGFHIFVRCVRVARLSIFRLHRATSPLPAQSAQEDNAMHGRNFLFSISLFISAT